MDDIGRPKVQATADLCQQIEHLLAVEEIYDRFRTTQEIGTAVFCCDSISTRAAIWRAVEPRCAFRGDGRMLGEVIRTFVATADQGRKHYATTLFTQAEVQAGRCTSRSTIYAASLAAALLVHQFTRYLLSLPLDISGPIAYPFKRKIYNCTALSPRRVRLNLGTFMSSRSNNVALICDM